MSLIDEIVRGGGSRQFMLEVDGLPVRYWSGQKLADGTLTFATSSVGNVTYKERRAIVGVGSVNASFALEGGVAEHSPCDIELAIVDPEDPWDPVNVFGRCGSRSATYAAEVLETIPSSTAATTLTVSVDATGLTFPQVVYVGDECMLATSATGVVPYTLSVKRAQGGTLPQRHEYTGADGGDAPLITDAAVFFRNRFATLSVFEKWDPTVDNVDFPTPVQVYRGIIESSPAVDVEAQRVVMSLQPLTARLDMPLGVVGAVEVNLLKGWHYFYGGKAEVVAHIQYIDDAQTYMVENASAAGSGFIDVFDPHARLHADTFQAPTGATPQLPPGHPREGVLTVRGVPVSVLAYSPAALAPTGFTVDSAYPLVQLPAYDVVRNKPAAELHRIRIVNSSTAAGGAATTCAWPDVLFDRINSQTGWMPGQMNLTNPWQGTAGQWADVQLTLKDATYGSFLGLQTNVPQQTYVAVWGHPRGLEAGILATGELRGDVSVDLLQSARYWTRDSNGNINTQDMPSTDVCLWYGLSFARPDADNWRGVHTGRPDVDLENLERRRIPIMGAADAWYQRGERYIAVDGQVPIGADGTRIRIEYDDIFDDFKRKTFVTSITDCIELTDPSSNVIGYALEIDSAVSDRGLLMSFGDWSSVFDKEGNLKSTEAVRITPVAEFGPNAEAHEVILQLLTSVAGQQVNGTYDVLPWGCGIPDDMIDTASIRNYPYPAEFRSGWKFRFPAGSTAKDVLEPMLRLFGAVLAMRTDSQGRCRLTMFPLTMETSVESTTTLDSSRWVEGFQTWSTDDNIKNVFRFKYNFNDDGDPEDTVEIRNQRSIRNHGGERGEMEFELLGYRSAARARAEYEELFRETWSRFSALYGEPRRLWQGRLASGFSLYLGLGSVATVTSPWLKAYDLGLGVTGLHGRVRRISTDWWGEGAEVELVHYGVNGTGWNAAMQCATVVGATTITVQANAFSDSEDPHTGADLEDIDGFAVGDVVFCLPVANEDNHAKVTITRRNTTTRQVGFSAAHGLGVGGYVVPSSYDVASTTHRTLGYLADANGTLGASSAPAKDYV